MAVLLYHADVRWMKGGFLGVDVFFVLSGYLVTSIVVAGFRKTGELGFRRFWAARFRRLAPAQLALIVAVIAVVALFYSELLATLRGPVLAALTGTMNWYLIKENASYFDQLGRPLLLRHLWSLAVELQYYLVFPPLLVLMLKRWGDRIDRILLVLGAAVLGSTIYLAYLYGAYPDPSRAYFDTFSRLAAPLLGSMLALVWQPTALQRGPARRIGPALSAVGAGAVVVLVWLLHVADDRGWAMYHGGFLFTAVVSTVIVAALVHPTGWLGGRKVFGSTVLVAIGLRSYALYLWHWPIFMLIRPRIDVSWSWGTVFVVRMVITVICAELCYRFIEKPWHQRSRDASWAGIKRRLLQPSGVPTRARLAALGGTVLVLASAVVIALPHAPKEDIADSLEAGQAAIAQAGGASATPGSGASGDGESASPTTTLPGQTTTTTLPENVPPSERTVTLVGDSVMVGAAPDIYTAFGDRAFINAAVSRQAADLAPVLKQLEAEGHLNQVVVAQVGINGTVTEENLRAIEEVAAGRPLYIINARVPRSWEQSNNELVAELVPKLENGQVIDWYAASNGKRDWFLDDGIHLTEGGRVAYANLIRKAVDNG